MKHEEGQVKKTPLTKELLHELHWVKGLSTRKIAEEIGLDSPGLVRYYMKKMGVPISDFAEAKRLQVQREVERIRQCMSPDVRELLKKLERDPMSNARRMGASKCGVSPQR